MNSWKHKTLMDRFHEKVIKVSRCWFWTGYINPDGYGKFRVGKNIRLAHRVGWEKLIGRIPKGLTLDHLCQNRRCVNPKHLEPVTFKENLRRSKQMRVAIFA